MDNSVLNSELIATKAGNITVYSYDGETREYISTSSEYLAVGVGIPAYSCTDAPPEPRSGFAICRNLVDETWEFQPDHRGEKVWSTADCSTTTIDYIGSVRDGYTDIAPLTPFDKWDGEKWATDTDAQHTAAINRAENERQKLLKHADTVMLDWRTELMLGEISDNNRAKLSAWLAYKNEVKAVDVTSDPEHVNWPVPPDE